MAWGRILSLVFLVNVLAASVRLATPLVLAALGEAYAERSGVFNLGIEGIMLLCGFIGFAAAYSSGQLWLGVLCSALAGLAIGAAFVAVTLKADQTATGFAFYLMCTGAAMYLNKVVFHDAHRVPQIQHFSPVPLRPLDGIPVLGTVLFKHNILTYGAGLLVLASMVVLYKTRFGLRVSAVGESPEAADSVGVSVAAIRYACVIVGGALAGVAGAFYSLADMGLYVDNMIGGRGFIALALVVFGQWNPGRILLGGLLFGVVDAVQARFQILGSTIPPQFLIMAPYALTLAVLLFGRRRRAPSSLALPYIRG